MFEILGFIFGLLVFCPFWDKTCDIIFGKDYEEPF